MYIRNHRIHFFLYAISQSAVDRSEPYLQDKHTRFDKYGVSAPAEGVVGGPISIHREGLDPPA